MVVVDQAVPAVESGMGAARKRAALRWSIDIQEIGMVVKSQEGSFRT